VDGIRKISSKKAREEHDFSFICGSLVVSFLILLAMPCFLRLANESLAAQRSYGSVLFPPSQENRMDKKSSKYSAALLLAKVGIERAVWELNHGNISSWQGNSQVRTMTISSFQDLKGQVMGDVEIKVERPDGNNPVVESTGRVAYTDSLLGGKRAKIMLQRQARVVLEKKGHHGYQILLKEKKGRES
jgi:hypothetical protein